MNNYTFDIDALRRLLSDIILANCPDEFTRWLTEAVIDPTDTLPFNEFKAMFSRLPRKLASGPITASPAQKKRFKREFGLYIDHWDIQRIARLWMIAQLEDSDKTSYVGYINDLFSHAEMNELATLYAALPVFAYPEEWVLRCAEGVRSNIGVVLDAVLLNNPYPAKYLNESAWNQLILRAFFTDKDSSQIIGVEKRANKALAKSLKEYIEERQAADRSINEALWTILKINDI